MRNVVGVLLAIAVLGLLLLAGSVAAEVVWTDQMGDPADDVADDSGDPIQGRPEADILSVTMADEGDHINLTMELAGAYDSSGGMYTIYMEADGGDSYQFSRVMYVGFMGTGPDQGSVPVDGHVSGDGRLLSWVVAKSDIDATDSFEIDFASATSTTGQTAVDYAGTGAGPDGGFVPSRVTLVIEFPEVNVLRFTATQLFEGQGAASLRDWLDADDDGTITAAEIDDFEAEMKNNDIDINMTLDGKAPTSAVGEGKVEGAEGPTQPTTATTIVATVTVTFPEPGDADTHTYAWPYGEPPGGEDWDSGTEVTFKMVCPEGWRFATDGWPVDLEGFLNGDGTEITMGASDYESSFGSTVGQMESLVVEKVETKDGNPGFGLVAVVGAVVVAAVAVRRRR